jgi:IclR family KDG regulon transcriptional repressor
MNTKVQSLDRTFNILEILSQEQNGLSLTEIATRINLPRSTVFRLLASLRSRGYIEKLEKNNYYRLGLSFIELCSLYLNNLELKTEAAPFVQHLSARTGCTAFLAIRQEAFVVYIDKAEQYNSIRKYSIIGQRRPLYCTSLGKALLLGLAEREIHDLLDGIPFQKAGPKTHESLESLLKDLEVCRLRGWTMDDEEAEPGIRCLAAPIRDYRGQVIAAVSASFRIADVAEARYGEISAQVQETALGVSQRMGYSKRTAQRETTIMHAVEFA